MSEQIAFGAWLRLRRNEQGIKPDELAEHIGCSSITLRKIEAGERRPSRQIAALLAGYFRIPSDEQEAFITFARSKPTQTASPHEALSGEVAPRAPWRGAHLRQTNLPSLLTPLIGRKGDEEDVRAPLLQPKVRLLTLTGPPGIGKTRLAMQVASELVDHFEDGVYFVDLAPVSDPDAVLAAIARALGLKEAPDQPIGSVLLEHLRERRVLLLLDNFEQVLDAAPQIVKLLESCPWLKALVTSREALHVRGERRYPVTPLAVPDLKGLPTLEALGDYPAVELFVERAQAVLPTFALTEGNVEDVAAVCRGLDGLPLAIELAAARASYLSPREIRAALESRLKLLTEGARDLPARHRTLRAAIEWSYNLLDESERALFRRLGVFVGGFTPEAVESICSIESGPAPISLLALLASKNLIRREREDVAGALRFRVLETLREYALERLEETGEAESIQRKHALYFMRLAEEAEPKLAGAKQGIWLARLQKEHDNLRAALAWALGPREDSETALRLSSALLHFWLSCGYWSEGRRWLREALKLNHSKGEPFALARARALNAAGHLARRQGDVAAARPLHEASLGLHRELKDAPGAATALNNLGLVLRAQGEYAQARALIEEGLALWREIGDKNGIATSLNCLGIVARTLNDQSAAREFFTQSLELYREVGDKWPIALLLNNLGLVLDDLGNQDEARTRYQESLEMSRALGDKAGISNSLHFLGAMARARGEYDTARSLFEESLGLHRELVNKQGIASVLGELGDLAYAMGDYVRAYSLRKEGITLYRALGEQGSVASALHRLGTMLENQGDHAAAQVFFKESLTIHWQARNVAHVLANLVGMGRLAAVAGDAHRGSRLLGATDALWEALNVTPERGYRTQYEEGITSAQAQLGEETHAKAWAEGRAMTLEEAVAYALAG